MSDEGLSCVDLGQERGHAEITLYLKKICDK